MSEKKWLEKYLSALVGGTIERARVVTRDRQPWIVLDVRATFEGRPCRFEVEVSQDPEGNGPGFLFGLPVPS